MPKPTLEEILSLPDVLLQDNFEMVFTSVPVLTQDDIRQLRLQCMSSALPGRTLETAPINLFGYEVHQGGRNTTTHTFTANFIETRALTVHRVLSEWLDLVRSKRTGAGVSKQFYAGRARLTLLSEANIPAGEIELINIFPETLPEVTFDGASTAAVQASVTFKFDEFIWINDRGAPASNVPGGAR